MAVLLSRDGFWAWQDPVSEALPPAELQRISPVRGHFLSGQFHCLRFRLLCSMLSLPTDSQPTRTHAEWQGQWKDTLSWVKAFTVYLLCPRDKKRGLWNVPGAGGRPFVSVLFKPENGENENESIQELWPWSRKKRTPPQCPAMTNGFFHSLLEAEKQELAEFSTENVGRAADYWAALPLE